jgi:hypothetical protein
MKNFKAGQYINQGYYKSFQPNFINKQIQVDDMEVIKLLSQADRELGRLDMYSKYIPNIEPNQPPILPLKVKGSIFSMVHLFISPNSP